MSCLALYSQRANGHCHVIDWNPSFCSHSARALLSHIQTDEGQFVLYVLFFFNFCYKLFQCACVRPLNSILPSIIIDIAVGEMHYHESVHDNQDNKRETKWWRQEHELKNKAQQKIQSDWENRTVWIAKWFVEIVAWFAQCTILFVVAGILCESVREFVQVERENCVEKMNEHWSEKRWRSFQRKQTHNFTKA